MEQQEHRSIGYMLDEWQRRDFMNKAYMLAQCSDVELEMLAEFFELHDDEEALKRVQFHINDRKIDHIIDTEEL